MDARFFCNRIPTVEEMACGLLPDKKMGSLEGTSKAFRSTAESS